MQRSMFSLLTLIGVVAAAFLARADEPPAKEAPAQEAPDKDAPAKEPTAKELAEQAQAALAKHRQLSYGLPGRPPFQTAEGIARLELTDEQKQRIRDIGMVFNGKVLDQRQAAWAHERKAIDLTGEEKEKFLKDHFAAEGPRAEERRKWALEARRLVEKVLTEKQLKLLQELEFEQRTQYLAYQPQVFAQLKLEQEQQEKMQQVQQAVHKRQQELMAEMQKLHFDASAKMVGLLTPQQREQLRKLLEEMHESSLQVR